MLIGAVLLSTHNICFGWEIRKIFFFNYRALLSGGLFKFSPRIDQLYHVPFVWQYRRIATSSILILEYLFLAVNQILMTFLILQKSTFLITKMLINTISNWPGSGNGLSTTGVESHAIWKETQHIFFASPRVFGTYYIVDQRRLRRTCAVSPEARETMTLLSVNNKGADQPAHPCSLISAFVIRLLESI